MKKNFKENAQWASHRQHLCHAQHVFCVVLCVVLCSSIRWHFLCCIIFVLQHDFNTMLLEHASAHRVEVDSEQTSVSMLCVRLYCTHPSRVRNVWQRRFVDLIIFIQHVFNPNGFQKICPDNDHNTYRKQFKCKSTCFHPMTCFCILISSCLYVSVGFCGSLLLILVNVFTVPRLQKYESALTASVAFEN